MKRETVEEYIARGGKADHLPPAPEPKWAADGPTARSSQEWPLPDGAEVIIEIDGTETISLRRVVHEFGARIPREFDIHHQRAKREEEAT